MPETPTTLIVLQGEVTVPRCELYGAFSMSEITRKIVREVRPMLAEAVRRGDYEAFKEILSLAGIPLGSDEFRAYEAQF